jgi:hypothetical protein
MRGNRPPWKGTKMNMDTTAGIIKITSAKRLSIIDGYRSNKIDARKYQIEMLALANYEARLLKQLIEEAN